MEKITLHQLRATPGLVDELVVRSLANDLYRVEAINAEKRFLVTDDAEQALTFTSPLTAKRPFKGLGIRKASLVHRTSYDEMIGSTPEGINEMVVTIQTPDQDLS